MKKWIVVLLILAGLGGGGYYYWQQKQSTPIPTGQGLSFESFLSADLGKSLYDENSTLEVTKGTVILVKADGTSTEAIGINIPLNMGDTIKVGKDGAATLHWFEGSESRLSAGTQITIQKADYNTDNVSETHINFKLLTGQVWSKVIDLVNPKSEFLAYVSDAVAGVRGSVVNIKYDETLEVQSIEHAAFLAKIDPKTKEWIDEKTLAGGDQAEIKEDRGVEVKDIPKEELENEWAKENRIKDENSEKEFKEKNLKRIKELTGPLPGTPEYEDKQKMIQEKLDSTEDPQERARIEEKLKKLKTLEWVALATEGKLPENELKDADKETLEVMDRSLDGVLADESSLHDLKEKIREKRLEQTKDLIEKEALQSKLLERKLFEISDLSDKKDIPDEIISKELDDYSKRLDLLKDQMEKREGFDDLHNKLIDKIEKEKRTLEPLKKLKEEFKKPEEEKNDEKPDEEESKKPKLPEKSVPTKETAPIKMTPKELDEKAPFRKGPSVQKPVPVPKKAPKEEVIKEAPYYKGPSR